MEPNTFNYSNGQAYPALSPEIPGGIPEGFIMAVILGLGIVWLIFVLVIYFYMAVCLTKIARKTSTPNAWLAWIPIFNIILMIQIAKKPLGWMILLFIPLVNIVILIIIWMEIAKVVKEPEWLGILMIIPIANLIVPGYLAFSKMPKEASGSSPVI